MKASLKEEKKLWKKGYRGVACLDEVGRGCLAGPVVAAAVVLEPEFFNKGKSAFRKPAPFDFKTLKDSKKLSPKKRKEFYKAFIRAPILEFGIGRVSERVIDRINILEATKLAMTRAIWNLERKLRKKNPKNRKPIDYLILDGKIKLSLPLPQKSIIKADEKVFSCAAASIVAKVRRDTLMEKRHKDYPFYGFDRHKGYATKDHLKNLKKHSPCPLHRKSFFPVKVLADKNTVKFNN